MRVFEKDVHIVKFGQKVTIMTPAYPDRTFVGAVRYVGDVLDEKTQTLVVRCEIANQKVAEARNVCPSPHSNRQTQSFGRPYHGLPRRRGQGELVTYVGRGFHAPPTFQISSAGTEPLPHKAHQQPFE